jgi:hypothetical protein
MKEDSAMADLSDLLYLLDAERDIDAPVAEVQARMLARLEAALPLPPSPLGPSAGAGAPSGGAGAASGGAGAASGALGKVLYSALLLAIGAAAGAGAHAALTSRASVSQAPPVAVSSPIVVSSQPPEPPPEPTVASLATSSAAPAAPPTASVPAPADERARHKAQLKTERLLLEAAQTALRSGDTESALGALRRHAREFPHGQLVEERELMMVQALNASGDSAAARRRAAEFKKQFQGSLMQDAVDQASKEPTKP